jgi:hypothetical protein
MASFSSQNFTSIACNAAFDQFDMGAAPLPLMQPPATPQRSMLATRAVASHNCSASISHSPVAGVPQHQRASGRNQPNAIAPVLRVRFWLIPVLASSAQVTSLSNSSPRSCLICRNGTLLFPQSTTGSSTGLTALNLRYMATTRRP